MEGEGLLGIQCTSFVKAKKKQNFIKKSLNYLITSNVFYQRLHLSRDVSYSNFLSLKKSVVRVIF